MSVVETFFKDTYTNKRFATISGNRSLTTIETGTGLLDATQDKSKLLNDGNYGKEYKFYTYKTANILVGDEITINGRKYGVGAFSDWPDIFEGSVDDFQAIIITVKNVNE